MGGTAAAGAASEAAAASLQGASGARPTPVHGPAKGNTHAQRHGTLLALCAIARLHQVAADPDSLAHQLGLAPSEPVGTDELLRAARLLGLQARLVRTSAERLVHTPLPALALMRAADTATGDPGCGEICLLAQCDGGRVLVTTPGVVTRGAANADVAAADAPDAAAGAGPLHAGTAAAGVSRADTIQAGAAFAGPRIESLECFAARWSGQLILVTSRASMVGAWARFDFSWFVPALVKYRHLLGEVLLVSFMLQLFALVSPLFFQVVMDKVLVHKALTTLDVLVAGLVIVVVFESVLSAVRSFVLGRGHGVDGVYENDATPGNTDIAEFVGDIAAEQLWFRRAGSTLEVGIIGTQDQLRVGGWYNGDAYRIEQFRSGDGRTLLDSQVQNLVDAMAGFAPPPIGQTYLSDVLASQLAPVIAANWN